MDTVASEMERLLSQFRERNPAFSGTIAVGGHSLGSVILFDLLMHQTPSAKEHAEKQSDSEGDDEKPRSPLSNGVSAPRPQKVLMALGGCPGS